MRGGREAWQGRRGEAPAQNAIQVPLHQFEAGEVRGELQAQDLAGAEGRAAEAARFVRQRPGKTLVQGQREEIGETGALRLARLQQRPVVHKEGGAVPAEGHGQGVAFRPRPVDQHVAQVAAVAVGDAGEAAQLPVGALFGEGPGDARGVLRDQPVDS